MSAGGRRRASTALFSSPPMRCAADAFATHPSAAMRRGESSSAPPPQPRPRHTTARRYPMVFERLQPPQPRPTTSAERWQQRTGLQRPSSAQTPVLDNRLRQKSLTELGYRLPPAARLSSTLATETAASSPPQGAPPLPPCRLTAAYDQAAPMTPSRTYLPPRAAWNDSRSPSDEQGPWQAMLLAANWSNYMEGEAGASAGGDTSLGGMAGDLGDAGASTGVTPANAQGAREMGRHMREAGFGRGRHMRAAMWD